MSKLKRGMGEYQKRIADKKRESILKILSDGEWHQYSEIKEKAKLTNPTLSKHLKEFKKGIEKKEGEEDSRIVYYKLKWSYLLYSALILDSYNVWQPFKETLLKTKNPLLVLKEIDAWHDKVTLSLLKILKENRDLDRQAIKLLLELQRTPFEFFIYALLVESREILDEINIDSLLRKVEESKGE